MIPYRKVAEKALYEWDYQYSIDDKSEALNKAHSDAENLSLEDLEGKVYAKGSMNYAMDGIAKFLEQKGKALSPEEIEKYKEAVLSGPENADILSIVSQKIASLENPNELAVAALSNIHDGWVKDNGSKFSKPGRNKQYQHMPVEMIGWKETKLDLLFLKPILEASGITVDEPALEGEYNKSVIAFLKENNILSIQDAVNLAQKGEKFYPALEGQAEINEALANSEFANEVLAPQLKEKGLENFTLKLTQEKDQKGFYESTVKNALSEMDSKALNGAKDVEEKAMGLDDKSKDTEEK